MSEAIYTERKIVTGVLLGGPLAGGYFFWRTFNALGKRKQATVAIIVALAVLGIIIASLFIPFLDRIPNFAYYSLQGGLTYGVTRGYLATPMTAHIEAGKSVYGWGNTILISLVACALTVGLMLAFLYVAPDHHQTRYYRQLKHEIVFDPAEINEVDVGRIAAALTSAGFFDEEMQKSVDATESGDRFIITIYCNPEARDPTFLELCRNLRSDVQKSFPSNPIVLDLVDGTPNTRIARLE